MCINHVSMIHQGIRVCFSPMKKRCVGRGEHKEMESEPVRYFCFLYSCWPFIIGLERDGELCGASPFSKAGMHVLHISSNKFDTQQYSHFLYNASSSLICLYNSDGKNPSTGNCGEVHKPGRDILFASVYSAC